MTTPDETLDALLLRHLDGTLDESSRHTLEERLGAEPAAAARLALLAADQIELRRLLKRAEVGRQAERASEGRVAVPEEQFPVRPKPQRRIARRWVIPGALSAAAVLLVAVLLWSLRSGLQIESGQVLVDGVETTRLREGDRFRVTGNEPAVVRLADGSRVQLDADSEAVARGTVGGTRQVFELAQGLGRFQVEKSKGAFRVETPSGNVTVLGTEFTVELQPGPAGGEENMSSTTALKLVVAVVVGSVQVDWSGGHVKLGAGDQQAFAAEGEGREGEARGPKKENKEQKAVKEGREGKEGEGAKVTLTGRVVATEGQVQGEGGRMVTRVTAVQLVVDEVTYNVKPDRNGVKLGQTFGGRETTVHGVLVRGEGGPLLVVTGIPSLGGDRPKEGDGGRVKKIGEGDRPKEGEGQVKKVGEGDRVREGEGQIRKVGEGDRVKEGEAQIRKVGEGDRVRVVKEGEGPIGEKATLTGLVDATFARVRNENGDMVDRVTAVKLVTDRATYRVKLDRNGYRLGEVFDAREVTVSGLLVKQEGGPVLIVTGLPAGGGEGDREGGERRAPKVGEGDRPKEGEGVRVKRDGEGDRPKEGDKAVDARF